jgi:hypothetical protein
MQVRCKDQKASQADSISCPQGLFLVVPANTNLMTTSHVVQSNEEAQQAV